MKRYIIIVDDEPDIVEMVSINLKKSGFEVDGFSDAKEFYISLQNKKPDLLILDLMLPDDDGLEICKKLKSENTYADIPIIILSAKSDESDKIVGLELGADDYVTKPFSPRELVARVKAILRRREREEVSKKIVIGDEIVIDVKKYEVSLSGEKIALTTTEFKILALLVSKKGVVFSRDQILDHLWGDEKLVVDRTIDMHIKNLRKKLGKHAQLIKSLRGIGYKIEE
jgi:two-component system phosphate regulon response regulator PhoB/two-component system alkaline phosphatase synthesis response regulator PhoP